MSYLEGFDGSDGIFLIVEMDSDVIILWTMQSEGMHPVDMNRLGWPVHLFGIGDQTELKHFCNQFDHRFCYSLILVGTDDL
jgi:hypothetical protein